MVGFDVMFTSNNDIIVNYYSSCQNSPKILHITLLLMIKSMCMNWLLLLVWIGKRALMPFVLSSWSYH